MTVTDVLILIGGFLLFVYAAALVQNARELVAEAKLIRLALEAREDRERRMFGLEPYRNPTGDIRR